MKHQQVIEDFISGKGDGRGTYIKANDGLLYSEIPLAYSPYGRGTLGVSGQSAPLAARLEDDSVLVNGARLPWPISDHQEKVLQTAQGSEARFAVVPFHSIVAAFTDGDIRDWNRRPIPPEQLRDEVGIAIPSSGERWRKVTETDKHGRPSTHEVHTLGDTVLRIRERYYLSAVDPTGRGNGMYFLAELLTDRKPRSLKEAFNYLKPRAVREAEAHGLNVRRQGEWFAIPTKLGTSELMRDVERGHALYRERLILGKDGHHELEEAVIYRHGPRKGQLYARGVLKHTEGEHWDLDLGMIRWHLVQHNRTGQAYTLSGSQAQFD